MRLAKATASRRTQLCYILRASLLTLFLLHPPSAKQVELFINEYVQATLAMKRRCLLPSDYTVGWICALPVELAAGQEMLDEEDDDPLEYDADSDLYTFGRIGQHNVILACLPAGQTGTNSAAAVATRIASTFTCLRFSLMVGIGGGVPSAISDVRLGDAVISQPFMQHGGVVQYDFGKIGSNGHSMRTGALNAPPAILLKAVSKLRALHYRGRSNIADYLSTFDRLEGFSRDAAGPDILYEAAYNHVGGTTCEQCSKEKEVKRPARMQGPVIHYGTIASGNRVIQDGITRDRISEELCGVLCYEMEAAGLMNAFPCLVIRGICDYADSHKNKKWQPYAAATAAACAKEILSLIPAKASLANTGPLSEEYARQLCQIKFPSEEIVKLQQGIKTLQEQSTSLRQQYDTSMTVGQHHLQAQYALLQQLRTNLVDLKHQALERELPPEIRSNAFVTVFDGENRPVRFVFDKISSKKIVGALKRQLKDVELDNMRRGEWYIQDRREHVSDPTELSSSLLRPDQCLDMSVKFRLRNTSSTLCPVCHLENPGDSDQQVTCQGCGFLYRRIEDVEKMSVVMQNSQAQLSIEDAQHPHQGALLRTNDSSQDIHNDANNMSHFGHSKLVNT